MTGFFSTGIQTERPAGMVPRCGICGLYKTCQSPKMPVAGKGRRRVLVVGEAPGQTEDEEGRPFIGKAGRYLRDTLDEIGVDLDRDAWTTNALICRPPKNATPDIKQISHCRPNLLNAIAKYEPMVIITLGRSALISVMESYWKDLGLLERWVGWKIPLARHWVLPTYHPSFLLRMKNSLLDRLFTSHLQQAFRIVDEPPVVEEMKVKIETIYDDQEIYEAVRSMDEAGGWVSADYETNCLKAELPKARIYSFAMSNGERTISFPWTQGSRRAVGMFWRSNRTRKIASNLKFEERWTLKEYGHGVTNWGWDTMLAAHCLDNRPDICSIKFQALVLLGMSAYNEHVGPFLKSHNGPYNRIHEAGMGNVLTYGGFDSLLEYKVAMIQRKQMGYEDSRR